jgi:AcrR family transcriptional regulator
MDGIRARILSRLYPDVFAPDDAGWQERKSAQTRIAVLEATIDSLQRLGYARTSTTTIAQIAKISRSAAGHHYATKLDLISAVLDYSFYQRMEIYTDAVKKLSEGERVRNLAGAELYWESLQTREYSAYLELAIASRTNPDLRRIFLPKAKRFDRIWREELKNLHPEFHGKEDIITLCTDFGWAILQGLMLNYDVWDSEERRLRLRALERKFIAMLRDRKISPPSITYPTKQSTARKRR